MVRFNIVKLVGLAGCWLALAQAAQGSDFSERLAKWNVGPTDPQIRRAAYDEQVAEQAAPMPATAVNSHAVASDESFSHPTIWQQMAFGHHDYGPVGSAGCSSCGPAGCGTCGSEADWVGPAACGQGCCGQPMVWSRFELLLWWRKGAELPPLVTTDPVSESSDTAGILPNATILYGNETEVTPMQAGARLDFGWWLDPGQCWGIGDRFYGIGREKEEFRINSLDNPVLAVPFFNVTDNANDALLVAYPGLRTGEIFVRNSSEIFGNDLYARMLFCRGCWGRIDVLTGYAFSRMNEDFQMTSDSTVVGGDQTIGTQLRVFDRFSTRNEFHGAILGLSGNWDCGGCWTWNWLARMSIGNMRETATVNGLTTITQGGNSQTTPAGLFATASNSGTFTRSEFTAITELGLTLGYKVAPCTQLTVGYTFMYWNDVLRPGNLIDTSIGTSTAAGTRPDFTFQRSDFWAQGLSLGLTKEF